MHYTQKRYNTNVVLFVSIIPIVTNCSTLVPKQPWIGMRVKSVHFWGIAYDCVFVYAVNSRFR